MYIYKFMMAYVGLPFLGTICPVPDTANVY